MIKINQTDQARDKLRTNKNPMTLNQIIGNKEKTSRIDTELWKKMNKKYSRIETKTEEAVQEIPLNNLEKTVVNTTTQKEYDTLMQIYDARKWKWNSIENFSENRSIEYNAWKEYRHRTCISIENSFTYSYIQYEEKKHNSKVISFDEFCETQNITPEIIKKLNRYYDKNYPNRESKGKNK